MAVRRVQIGRKYGRWRVLAKDATRPGHYLCVCKCGVQGSVYGSNLLSGRSGGCTICARHRTPKTVLRLKRRYGQWRVLYRDMARRGGNSYFVCRCSCGQEVSVHSGNLVSGKSTCCRRCGNRKAVLKKRTAKQARVLEDVPKAYWNQVVRSATARGHAVLLTSQEAWKIFQAQSGLCALSGERIDFRGWRSGGTASLDRISSDGEYEVGNVQWVHKDVNLMKSRLPQEVFIRWCERIARHHGQHKD